MQSILSTILLASSALALPASQIPRMTLAEQQTCTQTSSRVTEWTVQNFDYHASYTFSTPAHQIASGFVNFTLANKGVAYSPVCSAMSTQLEDFFYGTMIYDCEIPNNSSDKATFTFNRPTGEVQINQTWSCGEEGSTFFAEGGTKLDLECKEKEWENPNWQPGQTYSNRVVDCTPVTVKAPIETISAIL